MPGYLTTHGKRVLANGYNIVPIKPGTKAPEVGGWQKLTTGDALLRRWVTNGHADDGIGITTRWTPAVDVDVFDKPMLDAMVGFVETNFGFAPRRVGNAPKTALVYRTETPFPKVTSKAYRDPAGKKAQIEILGEGQQFVAYAVHPDTHQPYRWLGKENPLNTPADQLAAITAADAQAICREFERRAELAGWPLWSGTSSGTSTGARPAWADDPDELGPDNGQPLDLGDEELAELVAKIPNPDLDYDDWLKVGMAIWHETGGSPAGRDIWLEWSEKSLSKHTQSRFETSWNSFGKRTDRLVTARWLIKLAGDRRKDALTDIVKRMESAGDMAELRRITIECRQIETDDMDLESLADALKAAFARLGHKLGLPAARKLVRYQPPDDWLDGWCYLTHAQRFYHKTTREMITDRAFDAKFGKKTGDKKPSFYATTIAGIPNYYMTTYHPGAPEIITDEHGLERVNIWNTKSLPIVPAQWDDESRQVAKRIDDLFHLFYPEREAELILSWLAYQVQENQRPNWAVCTQSDAQGIGKTFIFELMARVFGRSSVYMLYTKTLKGAHTGWAEGKQFLFIDEIREFGNQHEIYETLKPLITNKTIDINRKFIEPYNIPNTMGVMAATNHVDALPLNVHDTRWLMVRSRYQLRSELDQFNRDNPDYWVNLYQVLDNPGACRKFFLDYKLHPDFKEVDRSPVSESKDDIIKELRTDLQREIDGLIADKLHPLASEKLFVTHIAKELLKDDMGQANLQFDKRSVVRHTMTGIGFTKIHEFREYVTIDGQRKQVWLNVWTKDGIIAALKKPAIEKMVLDYLNPL